ncbi:LYR motif-containing protein 2 isoform X2 [Stigmatopora argus]
MASSRIPPTALTLKQQPLQLEPSRGVSCRGLGIQHNHPELPPRNMAPYVFFTTAPQTLFRKFIQRQNILGLYRNILRTIRHVPDRMDRKYLRDWARNEFKRNQNATDQNAIRMMIIQAQNHLEELQRSLALAGN